MSSNLPDGTLKPAFAEQPETSARLRRPGLKDPKFIVGILLVLVSLVGTIAVIQLNNRNTQYYIAKNDIPIGEKISTDKLTPVEANLGSASQNYLTAEEVQKGDLTAVRLIPAGEVVSKNSASNNVRENRRLVTVKVDRGLATNLKAGDHVDIWASNSTLSVGSQPSSAQKKPQDDKNNGGSQGSSSADGRGNSEISDDSTPIAKDAAISNISVEESVLGSNGKATVQLWVASNSLYPVIQADSTNAKISLVPIALGEKK